MGKHAKVTPSVESLRFVYPHDLSQLSDQNAPHSRGGWWEPCETASGQASGQCAIRLGAPSGIHVGDHLQLAIINPSDEALILKLVSGDIWRLNAHPSMASNRIADARSSFKDTRKPLRPNLHRRTSLGRRRCRMDF